jgi:transposase
MHRARDLLVRQRTMLVNALRAHLAEFGIVGAQGVHRVCNLVAIAADDTDTRVPAIARHVLQIVANQIAVCSTRLPRLMVASSSGTDRNEVSQRLAGMPGVGPIVASAIAAGVPDASVFRCGREFAAWLGLVPKQSGTGRKTWLGRIIVSVCPAPRPRWPDDCWVRRLSLGWRGRSNARAGVRRCG